MTREEAREAIKEAYGNSEYTDEIIKALEKEPTTKNDLGVDCIVDVLGSYTDLDIPYKREIAENILTKLSSVTPQEPRWIPTSERLPEDDGRYLLWGKLMEDEDDYYCFIGDYDSCCEEFGYWENYYDPDTLGFLDSEYIGYNRVIAWMPLPEPYKAESEE